MIILGVLVTYSMARPIYRTLLISRTSEAIVFPSEKVVFTHFVFNSPLVSSISLTLLVTPIPRSAIFDLRVVQKLTFSCYFSLDIRAHVFFTIKYRADRSFLFGSWDTKTKLLRKSYFLDTTFRPRNILEDRRDFLLVLSDCSD